MHIVQKIDLEVPLSKVDKPSALLRFDEDRFTHKGMHISRIMKLRFNSRELPMDSTKHTVESTSGLYGGNAAKRGIQRVA